MSHLPIERNDFLLIGDEIYQIIGDYSDAETPLNWELENINNPNDTMMVNTVQMENNLGNSWKKINLDE